MIKEEEKVHIDSLLGYVRTESLSAVKLFFAPTVALASAFVSALRQTPPVRPAVDHKHVDAAN